MGTIFSYLSCIRKEPGAFASGFFGGRKRELFFLTEKAGGGTLNEIRWFV